LPSATPRCAAAAGIPVIHVLPILSGARCARGQAALPPHSFARMILLRMCPVPCCLSSSNPHALRLPDSLRSCFHESDTGARVATLMPLCTTLPAFQGAESRPFSRHTPRRARRACKLIAERHATRSWSASPPPGECRTGLCCHLYTAPCCAGSDVLCSALLRRLVLPPNPTHALSHSFTRFSLSLRAGR
jgi:hypothetical protein